MKIPTPADMAVKVPAKNAGAFSSEAHRKANDTFATDDELREMLKSDDPTVVDVARKRLDIRASNYN